MPIEIYRKSLIFGLHPASGIQETSMLNSSMVLWGSATPNKSMLLGGSAAGVAEPGGALTIHAGTQHPRQRGDGTAAAGIAASTRGYGGPGRAEQWLA